MHTVAHLSSTAGQDFEHLAVSSGFLYVLIIFQPQEASDKIFVV